MKSVFVPEADSDPGLVEAVEDTSGCVALMPPKVQFPLKASTWHEQ